MKRPWDCITQPNCKSKDSANSKMEQALSLVIASWSVFFDMECDSVLLAELEHLIGAFGVEFLIALVPIDNRIGDIAAKMVRKGNTRLDVLIFR
ncbi:MAG: hypothetical protein ACFFER_17410 [Candidatus Thorarchaeota archaeon]